MYEITSIRTDSNSNQGRGEKTQLRTQFMTPVCYQILFGSRSTLYEFDKLGANINFYTLKFYLLINWATKLRNTGCVHWNIRVYYLYVVVECILQEVCLQNNIAENKFVKMLVEQSQKYAEQIQLGRAGFLSCILQNKLR